ncbi:MAG: bifunctional demethylmenaquinone methyltransferase/2-methoxy-6-polyprenyl-1,4-benzoquinol methylase UbiE [Bacteroidia bacterium]
MNKVVTPYQSKESKKEQVTQMFDSIAPTYDKLNRIMTVGIDILWRRKAVKLLAPYQPKVMADIATGTGDFAIESMRLKPTKIYGIDISPQMLEVGKVKMKKLGYDKVIEMTVGDSEKLLLEDNSIDAITIGFGVRNFEDLKQGLSEVLRVLRPGGAVVILEPSFPTMFPLKQLFNLHFKVLTPMVGKLISGDDSAYKYLPESVGAFPNGQDFLNICTEVGFKKGTYHPLTFGMCSMYLLEK